MSHAASKCLRPDLNSGPESRSLLKFCKMIPGCFQALTHVCFAACLCMITVHMGLFDDIFTEVGYEYYAEVPIEHYPAFVAMPFNSIINLGYILLGCYWLLKNNQVIGNDKDVRQTRYLKDVFASMALLYGPVQWVRIWTQTHHSAILDQWLTLPIFAWLVVWCRYLEAGWHPWSFLFIECVSLASYSFTLLHYLAFDIILSLHILTAVWSAIRVHHQYGNKISAVYISLALLFCMGFIVLKLADHWLAKWHIFRELTGHFWSKFCDIMQFHFAFLFLTYLSTSQRCCLENKNI
ncbi:transmembrane protein 187 [Dromiciops gliroides]|uniref:transmembrane protein 187 n=1 Tax=Dromiciops gliroides TaxID=33562 RepID=UPI001CC40133|nr:transmembrane protein 187 [Dromiciops gliroides]XP_043830742.1 transmembrane protein 187 [Dromiciops gliroides]XP_043830743.1 transmembrane protein 187 [Dromiciops gliroides]XP_043830744.1 transmembrane protein 187 [Dromiciops gliroides]XP_043830745.1 transmembrane protein 187 [Dromiciops gliroides]